MQEPENKKTENKRKAKQQQVTSRHMYKNKKQMCTVQNIYI